MPGGVELRCMEINPYQSPEFPGEPKQSTSQLTGYDPSIKALFYVSAIAVAIGEAILLFSALVFKE